MKKTKPYIFIFLFIIFYFYNNYSATPINYFLNDSWEFVEYTFIIKPEKKLKSFKNRLIRWPTSLLVAIMSFYAINSALEEEDDDDFDNKNPLLNDDSIIKPTIYTVGTIVPTYLFYKLITNYALNIIEVNTLDEFLSSWPKNKEFVPEQLKKALDETYNNYYLKYTEEYKRAAPEIISLIKKAIYEHFPEKYLKYNKRSLFDLHVLIN